MSTIESRVNGRLAFKAKGAPETGSKSFSPGSDNDSADREFAKRRDLLVQIGRKHPEVRLAAFLVALVHLNPDQGTGSLVISEKTDSFFVADLLGLKLDELARHMLQFQSQGLVKSMPNGSLRITNLAALERLADGHLRDENLEATDDLFESYKVIVEPPRVYTRATTEAVSLSQFDTAARFDVAFVMSAASLLVALAIAFGIVGL
jgi:hypothetical protein